MKIKRIYVRRYRDTGQVFAHVDWDNGSRTSTSLDVRRYWREDFPRAAFGATMHTLFARAKREGLRLERETW